MLPASRYFVPLAVTLFVGELTPWNVQAQERHVLTGDATLWNLAGDVRIEPASGRELVVEVTRGGDDADRLSVRAEGGALRVRYPAEDIVYAHGRGRSTTTLRLRDDGTFGGGGRWGDGRQVTVRSSGRGLDAHADLVVRVPAGRRVAVHLAAGQITAANVDGEVVLDTHSADVAVMDGQGRWTIDTGSGDVRVEASRGTLRVDTGSGDVALRGLSAMTDVELDTGSGAIEARDVVATRFAADVGSGRVMIDGLAADALLVDSGSGSVRVSLDRMPRRTEIDTGSGRVILAVPADAGAELAIQTGSGDITSDLPIRISSRGRRNLRGRIGDGDARLTVSTGSASVRLEKR